MRVANPAPVRLLVLHVCACDTDQAGAFLVACGARTKGALVSAQHTPGPLGGLVGEKYAWTVRRARIAHHCRFCYVPGPPASATTGLALTRAVGKPIKAGDLYVEGDVDPYEAGGYGRERICLACIDKFEADELRDVGRSVTIVEQRAAL